MKHPTHWDSFKLNIADHTVKVLRTGKGSGKPVVLMLHGHTDHGPCWTNLARDLEATYDCIMPDMVGHGQSSRLNGSRTLHTMVAEISSLLYMLAVQEVFVIGHSMGAQLAAMVAAAQPNKVKAVVLEDPPWSIDLSLADLNPNRPEVHQWIADIERWKGMTKQAVAREKAKTVRWDKTDLAMYAESRQQCDIQLFTGLKWNALLTWQRSMAQITCPIMLITGNADKGALVDAASAERCLELQPATTHLHVATADHHIRRGQHAQVSGAITRWLAAR